MKATFPLSMTMRESIENLRRWAKVRARLASDEAAEPLPVEEAEGTPRLKQEMRNPFVPGATN
jgi:hypothetical protein